MTDIAMEDQVETTDQTTDQTGDKAKTETPICACGCDMRVASRRSRYRPGHDARHAGQIGRLLASLLAGPMEPADQVDRLLAGLPTDELKAKARFQADGILLTEQRRSQREAARQARQGNQGEPVEPV